jgi:hypothetical protein
LLRRADAPGKSPRGHVAAKRGAVRTCLTRPCEG